MRRLLRISALVAAMLVRPHSFLGRRVVRQPIELDYRQDNTHQHQPEDAHREEEYCLGGHDLEPISAASLK